MDYKRLNFEDYFTICAENYNKLKTNLKLAKYESTILLASIRIMNTKGDSTVCKQLL